MGAMLDLRIKMNSSIVFLCMVLILFCSCQVPNPPAQGWHKVFQNDEKGAVTFGDKEKLIEAVRLGCPVRIGWGGNRVEHVADAAFLTILEGEVFAQIDKIVGQAPRIEGDTVKIRFRTQNHWTKIAGTNGYSTGLMTDYFQDTIAGGGTDRYAASTWYVQYPCNPSGIEARPLWRKDSPKWESWQENNE